MAENQILVKFKPQGDKELINAINRLATAQKKLESGLKNVDNANKKGAKSSGLLDAGHKRLAATNGILANSFATIRSKMLLFSFAMSLGIRQVTQMAREAAVLEGMSRAFDTLSGGAGNATVAIDKLRGATNDTMSDFDLFQQANNAMVLGVSRNSDEMAEMFDIAQRLGRALGRDTRMSVESLITGIGRQSRLMLDNIGIIVKSEEAYEAYAKALGKSTDELTDSEKKQAFLTATMESARQKVSDLGAETLTSVDKFDQLSTAADNLQKRLGEAADVFTPLVEGMTKFLNVITDERIDRFLRAIGLIIDVFKVLAGVIAVIVLPPLLAFVGIGGTISAVGAAISSSFIASGAAALTASYGVIAIKDAIDRYLNPVETLTDKQKRFNEAFKEGADTLIDEDIGSSVETLAEHMLQYGESIETVSNALYFQMLAQDIIRDMHGKTKEGQLEEITNNIAIIDGIIAQGVESQKLLDIRNMFLEQQKKLNKERKTEIQLITERAIKSASANEHIGASAVKAAGQVLKARLAVAVADLVEDAFAKFGWLGVPLAASAGVVVGSIFQGAVNTVAGGIEKFEQGGLIGGRRHSQGGTMIEAERGEFVMSRNAVEAIGVENLNRMNQGGSGAVNITFTGNVMSQDFIENEAIPQIKDAIRRGADIGVS